MVIARTRERSPVPLAGDDVRLFYHLQAQRELWLPSEAGATDTIELLLDATADEPNSVSFRLSADNATVVCTHTGGGQTEEVMSPEETTSLLRQALDAIYDRWLLPKLARTYGREAAFGGFPETGSATV